jgi:two-component system sensor histidine kinase ChiS
MSLIRWDSRFPLDTTIRVKDTGIGINPSDLETIFQSFCQLEHSDAREHGGTGLGLAITKQLVELHGGTINVVSQPGKGTTFIFTMPTSNVLCERKKETSTLAPPINIKPLLNQGTPNKDQKINPATTQDPTAPKEPEKHSANKKAHAKTENVTDKKPKAELKIQALENSESITILSVDDDPINRMVLNGILKLHNYNVIEADNGQAAIAKVKQHPEIDLVILDVMMPKMTGYEACEILRKDYPIYDLPIIFLTAKDVETELTQGFLSGGNDFVSKPVNKEELLARIKAQLSLLLHARSMAGEAGTKEGKSERYSAP